MQPASPHLTHLLHAARDGDAEAADDLYQHVYEELRRIARQRLRRHRPGETLNTTALVHEAYLRLTDQAHVQWQDRAHFFATASQAMRYILIDYARRRTAQKRGGSQRDVPLSAVQVGRDADARTADLLTLNDALDRLADYDDRLARLVEYRFFGGLTYDEIAEVTAWSVPTLKRDWRRARAWLYRAMQDERPGDAAEEAT
jgi:RNA polymerase sigma factor (TIGR02999 family)